MICLGIESTAHTFGAGIVSSDGKVLSNVSDTYVPPKGWGIKPADAAAHHERVSSQIVESGLLKAGLSSKDISLVAYSHGPGLPPCLRKGLDAALRFSKENGIPVVGVNHCIAHIEIAKLFTKARDPVVLYVSGGNTQVLSFSEGRYRTFGETMDIGIGNALDKFGRSAGIGFPAGPEIERLARESRKYIELPYTVKGMDLSFSGIVTEALRKLKSGEKLEDVCFSLQETLFAMLTEVTERALSHTGKDEVIVTGGVAANSRLREMLETMCRERGARFHSVPKEFSGDNGAMIAWTGILSYSSGNRTVKPDIYPNERTDDVDVLWLK